jgi:hypothetical protein
MRIKFFAASLAFLIVTALPLPSRADWRSTLIRVIGPPLINRGLNYLMSNREHRAGAPAQQAYGMPYAQPYNQQYSQPYSQPAHKPARPRAPVVSHSVPRQSSSTASAGKLEVPPPPKLFVPPPPPGVPTGAVLGLYPPDTNYESESDTAPKTASLPKPAPDAHKKAQH